MSNLKKIKIYDGTTVAGVTTDERLKVSLSGTEITEGGQDKVWVSDDSVQGLLTEVVKQLKIMNLHLTSMTDEKIGKQEVG